METLVLATFKSERLNKIHEYVFKPKQINEMEIEKIIQNHLNFIRKEFSTDYEYYYFNLIGSYSTSKQLR